MSEPVLDFARARRLKLGNEPYLSKPDLARMLGFSVRWVEYRVQEGMPSKTIGGRLRFKLTEVERWLDEREAKRSA